MIALGTRASEIIILNEHRGIITTISVDPLKKLKIISILRTSLGFLAAGSQNMVFSFQKQISEEIIQFNHVRTLTISEETTEIKNIAINASETLLLCSTLTNQLFKALLHSQEILKNDQDLRLEPASQPFHHGAITGMDTCCRKPLLITCGVDKSIRVWNYITNICELVKYFPEESYSVALHPSGLYALVGFSDKLRLMNLLIDELRLFREFALRGCRECRFSNGGHVFAAAFGSMIQIWSTWTFENIANLKGHNGKVKSLHWTPDDSVLISSGSDGAVYSWNIKEMKRENEYIQKSCSYNGAICTPNGKIIYAAGSDKTLKVLN
ncbi:Cilia- and flagella-associated protein 57, partial [Nowakowskiella sp. JEL0078]